MLNRKNITYLKKAGGIEIAHFMKEKNDVKSINFILENLGKLPKDFNATFLFDFLSHPHKKVRLNAVKNIGKLNGSNTYFKPLLKLYKTERDTLVKTEIVSSLGRQRKQEFIPFFFTVLEEPDPKILSQAIRSLFVFQENKRIKNRLKKLINHPNEIVRTVIYKQYFSDDTKSVLPHRETYDFLKNKVVNADVLEALKYIPAESIHLTFTSPPYYNARDYSIYPSYEAYLKFLEKVFAQTHRITKEGRFLIVNTSPIIIPRISRAHSSKRYPIPFDLHSYIVKNGWEFIDDIVWLKPETTVKNRVGGFMQHRKPLGYKPNTVTEYLMVYRKETTKLLDWNMRNYSKEIIENSKVKASYESTNVWKIDPCFDKVHSAVFPQELCKRVLQYYSYKGDIVFDPFGGSGTLARVAKSLERLFFLTEQNPTYFDYMKSNIKNTLLCKEIEPTFETLKEFIKSTKNDIN